MAKFLNPCVVVCLCSLHVFSLILNLIQGLLRDLLLSTYPWCLNPHWGLAGLRATPFSWPVPGSGTLAKGSAWHCPGTVLDLRMLQALGKEVSLLLGDLHPDGWHFYVKPVTVTAVLPP